MLSRLRGRANVHSSSRAQLLRCEQWLPVVTDLLFCATLLSRCCAVARVHCALSFRGELVLERGHLLFVAAVAASTPEAPTWRWRARQHVCSGGLRVRRAGRVWVQCGALLGPAIDAVCWCVSLH